MDKFSSRHFLAIILAVSIVSLKTYPTIYIQNGMRDSWISMIIASVIILYFFMILINICKKNNIYTLSQIYTTALGNTMGKFFIWLLIITMVLTLVESSSVEANAMHTNLMLRSPVWYLLLFFIISCVYVVRKDIVAIVIVVIILVGLMFLAGITLAILTTKYKKIQYLFPIFANGINIKFFLCVLQILGLYGCVTISLPYLSRIQDTTKIMKHTFIGIVLLIQMEIVGVAGLIMTFTPERLVNLIYPKILETQLISYVRFIEYGELYVLLQVVAGWMLKYIVTFYALLILLKELNLKRKALINVTYLISLVVFIMANLAAYDTFFMFTLLNYYSYICLINFVVIPFFIFLRYSMVTRKLSKNVK